MRTVAGSAIVCAVSACLAACGGGGDPAPTPSGISDAQRTTAATAAAQSTTNPCATIGPFYWEVGDRNARMASGSVAVVSNPTTYASNTKLSIASASKWLYAAYVAQKKNAALTESDIKFLTFRSGYTNFGQCLQDQSVDNCVTSGSNGVHSAATDGYFYYDGGHMENHASQAMGLGPLQNAALASEIRSQLGADIAMAYSQPQLAGGVVTTADDYARFLRKLLGGQLQMAALLGSHPVCTNPATCSQALATPIPTTLSWHYSIGHWVEDDPATGDGAFSSAGAFGFYPWLDASKHWYGVVARSAAVAGSGYDSAMCGAAIRKAWVTGVTQ